jgi:two-component system, LytTR family, response regulator
VNPSAIDVLAVDDEPLARDKLRRWLKAEPEVGRIHLCGNGKEALAVLETEKVDLLFLDIQMPEMDGFELIAQIPPRQLPPVVFVTAHDRYAIDAFEVHALDYLLKPYDRPRFRRAFERALSHRRQGDIAGLIHGLADRAPQRHNQRFAVKRRDEIFLIDAERVDWLEAQGNYVVLHVGKEQHLVRDSLAGIETRFTSGLFLRIHRSALVNIDRVERLRPLSHGDCQMVLRDGTELLLSRTYREQARQALNLSF